MSAEFREIRRHAVVFHLKFAREKTLQEPDIAAGNVPDQLKGAAAVEADGIPWSWERL